MTDLPSGDDPVAAAVDPAQSIAAYRTRRGGTHVLYAEGGRLRDRDLVTGRDRVTPLAADEVVLTPTHQVLVIRNGDELTRASVLPDGAIAPFRENAARVPGIRRLLASRVAATDLVEAMVTTDDESLLIRLPVGRVMETWPFPATAAVGQDRSILLWAPNPLEQGEYEADPRIVPGSVLSADAAVVASGNCRAALMPDALRTSWETREGLSTRVVPFDAQGVAVVRSFGPEDQPVLVAVGGARKMELLDWSQLPLEDKDASRAFRDRSDVSTEDVDRQRAFSVFISYAHEHDQPTAQPDACCVPAGQARRLFELLEPLDVAAFWDEQLEPGDSWGGVIQERFHAASVVLVVWGHGSVQRWSRDALRRTLGLGAKGQAYEVVHCGTKLIEGDSVIPLLMPGLSLKSLPRFLAAQQALEVGTADFDSRLVERIRRLASATEQLRE